MDKLKVNFLQEASSTFNCSSHIYSLLKSAYLATARKIENDDHQQIAGRQYGKGMNIRCDRCLLSSSGNFDCKLNSKKCKSKDDEIVKHLDSNSTIPRDKKLSMKWYHLKKKRSHMQFKCKFCKHTNEIILNKPNKKTVTATSIDCPISDIKSKNQSSFMAQSTSTSTKSTKKKKNSHHAIHKHTQKNTSTNIIKSKTNQHTGNKNIKTTSKTQQKNTILQLAQMLKQENKKVNSRLQNLLR